jgi:uncharacterized cupin superfamily protein
MPKYNVADLPLIERGSGLTGPLQRIPLSDAGGLTQFGAWIVVLPPGSKSSIPHWHSSEDELIQVLEGHATLIEEGKEHLLGPGAVCAYPAGLALSHCFENQTNAVLRLLVIGTRSAKDVTTYPDSGLTLTIDEAEGIDEFRDTDGKRVPNPYDD